MFVMERTADFCVRHEAHRKMTMKNAKYEAEMLAGSNNRCVQTWAGINNLIYTDFLTVCNEQNILVVEFFILNIF